ncbi:hypothetical protein NE237_022144 [Protea cynaroides]|uniref:RING-type E3 ubiquitin transferase n=1 Tax=Protea cynaroides TaxID=273540 RepID=A0A9Q0HAE9_9MAGN|nr:hypothetical protein NE237_022144 [Protea cynaroides]
MANQMNQNQSHRSILEMFRCNLLTHHGLTYICLFLLFWSLPFTAAQTSQQSPPTDPYSYNSNFSPSMAIILVVLISAFFFMGFFSIYIRQCTESSGGVSLRGTGGLSRRANRGLDPAVIATFPTFAYADVKGLKLGKGALECAVCLNEFEDEETLRLLPKCDHVFHPECIDAWLSKRTTCPVCRANLVPEEGDETPAIAVPVQVTEGSNSDGEIVRSETGEADNRQLTVNVVSEEPLLMAGAPEVIIASPMLNRPARSRSLKGKFMGRFPRSHSTGHSFVQPGEDVERFTLRLPDGVRKQLMNKRQLNRTTSMVAFPRVGSSRKGYRMTGEGSSRGGRFMRGEMGEKPEGWVFSMTPPFFMRGSSARSPKMTADGDMTLTPTSPLPKTFRSPRLSPLRGSMKIGFPKADGTGPSSPSTRPPV